MNILVIADIHFSIFNPDYTVIDFINNRNSSFDKIILLGDTFDFYFPYRRFIPKEAALFIKKLSDINNHTKVIMIQGNHDPWQDDYFKHFNIEVIRGPLIEKIGNAHYKLIHGHEMFMHKPKNRLVHAILTHPVNVKLFSMLHPNIAYRLGHFITKGYASSTSKGKMIESVVSRKEDNDEVLVMGHIHKPYISEDKKLIVTGDFAKTRSYCIIDSKGVRIEYL